MTLQNFGLVREGAGHAVLRPIPTPKLREDYIVVRTVAVALNPTDWTTLDAVGDDGTIVGCDYAGIVEEVGKAVKKKFVKGDRVAGFGHGGNDANPENGAFARYIAVKGDIQLHIPTDVSFEAASTIGVGISTAGYGLYKILKLPFPGSKSVDDYKPILIYGGSTATGTIAIQFAKLSGYTVVTTGSPKHFQLLKDRGADLVYDYHTPNVEQQIREATNGRLALIFDTVSTESTAAICAEAFGTGGEEYIFEGETYPAVAEDYAHGVKFVSIAERLWMEGKWKPHPQRIEQGGLSGIPDGLQQMREGKYSGEKLAYRVDETEWQ